MINAVGVTHTYPRVGGIANGPAKRVGQTDGEWTVIVWVTSEVIEHHRFYTKAEALAYAARFEVLNEGSSR